MDQSISERPAGTALGTPAIPAGEVIRQILTAAGIRRVYAVPGESFLEVLDEAEHHPDLQLIATRHESGAAFMAEADAKVTGIPAVAAGTRGVGASNLAIGVHTACQDSTPMIVLIGQVATAIADREAFQEVDLPAFYAPITKWAATVQRTDRLPDLLAMAIVRATTGRRGPVMLALPADVLQGSAERELVERAIRVVLGPRALPGISDDDALRLAGQIKRAKRPVVIAGEGARQAGPELVQLSERFGLGVYAAFRRQDIFPNDHPNYLGHLTIGTPSAVLSALRDADLVIVLGARLDEVTTQTYQLPAPGAEVVHIDTEPSVAADGIFAGWSVQADVALTLRSILPAAPATTERDWGQARNAYLQSSGIRLRPARSGVDPAAVIAAMAHTVPKSAIISNDAGNFSAFLHLYWRYESGRSQLGPISGAMGYGVPAAVAAALAGGGRPAVAVCGDGGFLMTGQELETAVRYKLDLLVVVLRNGLYGTIAAHQARSFGRTAGVTIGPVDLAGFARSLGAHGYSVTSQDELLPTFEQATAQRGVRLIDIETDPDLISPAGLLSDLLTARPASADEKWPSHTSLRGGAQGATKGTD
jgi:acetolactate synthase-1/2/3 large subunit